MYDILHRLNRIEVQDIDKLLENMKKENISIRIIVPVKTSQYVADLLFKIRVKTI